VYIPPIFFLDCQNTSLRTIDPIANALIATPASILALTLIGNITAIASARCDAGIARIGRIGRGVGRGIGRRIRRRGIGRGVGRRDGRRRGRGEEANASGILRGKGCGVRRGVWRWIRRCGIGSWIGRWIGSGVRVCGIRSGTGRHRRCGRGSRLALEPTVGLILMGVAAALEEGCLRSSSAKKQSSSSGAVALGQIAFRAGFGRVIGARAGKFVRGPWSGVGRGVGSWIERRIRCRHGRGIGRGIGSRRRRRADTS